VDSTRCLNRRGPPAKHFNRESPFSIVALDGKSAQLFERHTPNVAHIAAFVVERTAQSLSLIPRGACYAKPCRRRSSTPPTQSASFSATVTPRHRFLRQGSRFQAFIRRGLTLSPLGFVRSLIFDGLGRLFFVGGTAIRFVAVAAIDCKVRHNPSAVRGLRLGLADISLREPITRVDGWATVIVDI
jgi:hypothetical protein